ncbi:S9 family peptidase [Aliidiomarina minuta]|uniref:S9 family peptidase n=1 Tax=Aliidiomarina minuta TaxID=880057 RepID=A0A432W3V6_9GAMM|nr:S9 family peptidase [Aliidiomarina minuta]RUO24043.1 S9 family peptidase [Aliidiomarina minuta]
MKLLKPMTLAAMFGLLLGGCASSPQDTQSEPTFSLQELYQDNLFAVQSFTSSRWLQDGSGYTTLESSDDDDGQHIVRYHPRTEEREVLVSAEQLTPQGEEKALSIADYQWSEDGNKVLIFTNTRRSWRTHTLGDYWVLDRNTDQLLQLGQGFPESTLQFAKFDPAGERVAYVMQNDIYVQNLQTQEIKALTYDGSDTLINGTFDWVNEEEFYLRDGFRWSPDGQHIAYWQVDTSDVPMFTLIDNVSELYPTTTQFPYPKVGETNSALRIGVLPADGGDTQWMNIPGEPRDHYLVRMEWAGNSHELLIQQMNRLQNTMHLWLTEADTGAAHQLLTEQSDAWVEQVDDVQFFNAGNSFTWLSERNGYRQLYRIDRETHGTGITPLTYGEHRQYDVIDVKQILIDDQGAGWVYYLAAPDNPLQQVLMRASLTGDAVERLTPEDWPGSHDYQISEDAEFAIHHVSRLGQAPQTRMLSLPDHQAIADLELNTPLQNTLDERITSDTEFFRVTARDGLEMDAYIMRPADFDERREYPLVMYVYGEPWGQTVADRWLGHSWLWHEYLTQQGYIVVSVDNRGTRSPRGQEWRHSIYKQLGVVTVRDQADALDEILSRWSYIDGDRVAIWGHSGGGSQTLNALFRYPDRFHVGIALAPVPDLRLYDTIYQERYSGLLPEEADSYEETSAVTHAANLEGELLLVHGTADDNVHYQGTERLKDELIRHQKQFRFMAYPNRTHGISEGEGTSLHLRTLMTEFLSEKLAH